MIEIDHKHLSRAVDARRERTKRINDYTDNGGINKEVGELVEWVHNGKPLNLGEYKKQISLQKKREKIMWYVIFGSIAVVYLLAMFGKI